MYIALQGGWLPPTSVTEEQYEYVKNNKDEDKALTGFIGFGCSFSGKWFGGYAKNNTGRNYCLNAYNTTISQLPKIKDVCFRTVDYKECCPKDALVYCDPPYVNTTKYAAIGSFNTTEFWDVVRNWSQENIVFVSEYTAPPDFECVLEIETKLDIRNKDNKKEQRIEKLFRYSG